MGSGGATRVYGREAETGAFLITDLVAGNLSMVMSELNVTFGTT